MVLPILSLSSKLKQWKMKFTMNTVLVQCWNALPRKLRVVNGHFLIFGFQKRMAEFAQLLTSARSICKLNKVNIPYQLWRYC